MLQRSTSIGIGLLVVLIVTQSGCSGSDDAAPEPEVTDPVESAVSAEDGREATSLLGEPLLRLELAPETTAEFNDKLLKAEQELAASPDSAEALIWLGRRTAYLGRYQEALDIFTDGVDRFPDDARFLRHRGHRYLSTRKIAEAVADFESAYELVRGTEDQIEPDGMPNARGIPTSTLHSNIRYHLGLGYVLLGDFASALPFYEEDVQLASNPDMRIASTYWLYLTLRRGNQDERAQAVLAAVDPNLEIIENHDYHRLLLYFRGDLSREQLLGEDAATGAADGGVDGAATETLPGLKSATLSYGVATFDLVNERVEAARALYRQILDGPQWSAFGYLAAEAELARL